MYHAGGETEDERPVGYDETNMHALRFMTYLHLCDTLCWFSGVQTLTDPLFL